MNNTTEKFVDYHSGKEVTFVTVKMHSQLSGVGYKQYDFNKDGSIAKRARGTRILRYSDEYGYAASTMILDPAREAKANPIRDRIKELEQQLSQAKDDLAKLYSIHVDLLSNPIYSKVGGYGKLATYAKIDGRYHKVNKVAPLYYTVDSRILQDYEIERINEDRAEHGLEPIANDPEK